jgi:hypothetical protein
LSRCTSLSKMPKAILEFNLEDEQDALEFRRCQNAYKMALVLQEIEQYIMPHADGETQLAFFSLLEEHKINISELTLG